MAKKLGKFVLFTAAIGTAAAAAYYYMQKRNADEDKSAEDEDYDDFSENDSASRNYVPLNHEGSVSEEPVNTENAESAQPAAEPGEEPPAEEPAPTFTPLSEQLAAKAEAENTPKTVEEFFDEDEEKPGAE